jgi:2-amino-4-hydroxy-6-hydroxymethyldihydropteridine diphosphokinase
MKTYILSLGSNVGNRLANLRAAAGLLSAKEKISSRSDVYETPPWGVEAQPRFLNACLVLETELEPPELLAAVKGAERKIGRVARERWGPREIDIDIISCGEMVFSDENLQIPHPRVRERAFVLVPLRDAAPGWRHPVTGESVDALLESADTSGIVRIVRL